MTDFRDALILFAIAHGFLLAGSLAHAGIALVAAPIGFALTISTGTLYIMAAVALGLSIASLVLGLKRR